jgi:hypothetical protein
MDVPDAETGELVRLNAAPALGDLASEREPSAVLGVGAGVKDQKEQFASSRTARGLPAVTRPAHPSLAVAAEEAAELHLLRAKLDEQVAEAVAREESREEHRQQVLAATAQKWKREAIRKEFSRERRQARRELENLRYDNEMALAHKLARMGLLK